MPGGARIKYDRFPSTGPVQYERWRFICTHVCNREKKRGFGFSKNHGPLEPVAYLMCWTALGAQAAADGKIHNREMKPTKEAIAEFCRANPNFMAEHRLDRFQSGE